MKNRSGSKLCRNCSNMWGHLLASVNKFGLFLYHLSTFYLARFLRRQRGVFYLVIGLLKKILFKNSWSLPLGFFKPGTSMRISGASKAFPFQILTSWVWMAKPEFTGKISFYSETFDKMLRKVLFPLPIFPSTQITIGSNFSNSI